jgi:hypothetical protein
VPHQAAPLCRITVSNTASTAKHDSECIPCELAPDAPLEFMLAWEEHGEPLMSHQIHRLQFRDGLIVSAAAWCGGRWGAALQAEMAEAAAGG